ncbi:MAG: hypothetical protein V4615_04320 [Bacteroidota bacterium]
MTKEEFDTTYKKAKQQYEQATDLMVNDAHFMEQLPQQTITILTKIRALLNDTLLSKTGQEALTKASMLKDTITAFTQLDNDMLTFANQTQSDWARLAELIQIYTSHCNLGELPKTKEGATEWVIQLDETSEEMLGIYTKLQPQIKSMRQRHNKLLLEAQPYLN